MSERRLYLDRAPGEVRGVVSLDGRPERLLIARAGDLQVQGLGARVVARVASMERAAGLAFLDLGQGPAAILNLTTEIGRLNEGAHLEIEIRTEARADKGATARFVAAAEGPTRLLAPGPDIETQLRAFTRDAEIHTGRVARSMADGAQEEALQTVFPLPGGGSLAVEQTRALVAVDVDLGERRGTEAKRASRAANLAALGAAARVLRLKGLGGLVVIDLVGRGHDAPALLAVARAAFGPDNPGVALGPVSRFGTLELTVPRRARAAFDLLTDGAGAPSALTEALNLIRAIEREAVADGGGRFEGVAAEDVAALAAPALSELTARLGARVFLRGEPARGRGRAEVVRL